MMGITFRFIKMTLWCGWWLLKEEVQYLRGRFQEAGQSGDMMVSFDTIYRATDEYLTGGLHPVGAPADLHSPDQPDKEPGWDPKQILADGAGMEELALRYYGRLNGRHGNQMWFRRCDDNEGGRQGNARPANLGAEAGETEIETEVEVEQTSDTRDERYRNAEMDKVSEPDHWAMLRHGHLAWDNYERMLAFSQANQVRLNRAIDSLRHQREQAEANGNWEETAKLNSGYGRDQSAP